jgi:DNA-directed RNA polymerase specialized sigma24 family protein
LSAADRLLIEQRYARRTNLTQTAEATGRNIYTLYKALERVRRRLLECVNRSLKLEGLL